jgi:hypothetical protein
MVYIKLESTASVLTNEFNTYPLFADGTPDFNEGVEVELGECTDEWYETLSTEDYKKIVDFLYKEF